MAIVTHTEAKLFLALENIDDDNDLIDSLIDGVTTAIEDYTQTRFESVEIEEKITGGGEALIVSVSPIEEVTSIANPDGVEFDLDNIDTNLNAGLIYKLDGSNWEGGRRYWTVTADVGYLTVPEAVKIAALTWIAEIYENRKSAKSENLGDHSVMFAGVINAIGMPDRVRLMLEPYRNLTI